MNSKNQTAAQTLMRDIIHGLTEARAFAKQVEAEGHSASAARAVVVKTTVALSYVETETSPLAVALNSHDALVRQMRNLLTKCEIIDADQGEHIESARMAFIAATGEDI